MWVPAGVEGALRPPRLRPDANAYCPTALTTWSRSPALPVSGSSGLASATCAEAATTHATTRANINFSMVHISISFEGRGPCLRRRRAEDGSVRACVHRATVHILCSLMNRVAAPSTGARRGLSCVWRHRQTSLTLLYAGVRGVLCCTRRAIDRGRCRLARTLRPSQEQPREVSLAQ